MIQIILLIFLVYIVIGLIIGVMLVNTNLKNENMKYRKEAWKSLASITFIWGWWTIDILMDKEGRNNKSNK